MKVYVVWFPKVGGYVGKRGLVEEKIERAVMFWQQAEAREWADVLGGEVEEYEEKISKAEEPF